MNKIIEIYEKETGKKALWGDKLTKIFKKWQDKNNMFAWSENEEVKSRREMMILKDRISELEKRNPKTVILDSEGQ